MAEGCIYIYTGDGRGKSPAAIGRAVQAAVEGKRVVIIQFLKGKGLGDSDFLRRMEPEIKLFRFEKSDGNFVELPEEKKQEEIQNIRNGIGFAKKVLTTGECDLLILDEVLGLVEKDIITELDGEEIRTYADLNRLLTYYKAGSQITFTVQSLEHGEYAEREVAVTLTGQ